MNKYPEYKGLNLSQMGKEMKAYRDLFCRYVALNITISQELKEEGYARELANCIQNYLKKRNLEATGTISIALQSNPETNAAFQRFELYIKSETLCRKFEIVSEIYNTEKLWFEIIEGAGLDAIVCK
jgi:isoleucyl-tRNA synthetase